jgi:GDPmannose 4,6-dehydratase
MKKRALITGITGMDGSHMADLLIEKNYEVFGTVRHTSSFQNLSHIKDKVNYIYGDITNTSFVYKTILESNPDEIYHLAAISHNEQIWSDPLYTYKCVAESTITFLEAIKSINKNIKFLNCSSSEIYGSCLGQIDETTAKSPQNPYGLAKYFAHQNVELYRNKFNLFACNAICFNHESERRNVNFVTRKISHNVSELYLKKNFKIEFGDINASKDWSYAPEIVDAMFRMLQLEKPEDFILASGQLVDIKSIIKHAFSYANIQNWENYIEYDEKLLNNRNNNFNFGNTNKAKNILNWSVEKSIFQIIEKMIDHDIKLNTKANNVCLVMI